MSHTYLLSWDCLGLEACINISDIDKEIALLDPEKTKQQITTLQTEKEGYIKKLSELKVVEPEQYYEEDKHDKVKEDYKNKFQSKIELGRCDEKS